MFKNAVKVVSCLVLGAILYFAWIGYANSTEVQTVACKDVNDAVALVNDEVDKGSQVAQARFNTLHKEKKCWMMILVMKEGEQPNVIFARKVNEKLYILVVTVNRGTLFALITWTMKPQGMPT